MRKMRWSNFINRVEGSVAIITALSLVALIGAASLAIDVGHLYTVRNELQDTADAAALAAAGNLIKDQSGVAVRDDYAAKEAALTVAQRQSQLLGLPPVSKEARTDLTVIFGEWNLYDSNPQTAWTEIGPNCGAYSNANAVRVNIRRASGLSYGPVTNFFAGILGSSTSEIQASATAYLGYTNSTTTGTVTVPVAISDSVLTAANSQERSWWANLLGPKEAIASAPKQITFKDLGSDVFYQSNLNKPQFDKDKAYLFLVNNSDPVPSTVVDNLKKNYTSGVAIRPIERGIRLYPISEYLYASNIKSIFQTFKNAYNAKKDPATGKWRVCVPVYSNSTVAQDLRKGLMYLARLIYPAPEAHACFTFWTQTYPGGNVPIYVHGFANVDIVNVNYDSGCDTCSPYAPAVSNNVSYLSALDCMVNNPNSCRNTNSVTIQVPLDGSTVSPPGSVSGGPSNQIVNPAAPGNVGAFASIPKLVK